MKDVRDGKKAIVHGSRACNLTGFGESDALAALAAAHAESGDFVAARRWQQKAIDVALNSKDDATVKRLVHAMQMYENDAPFRINARDRGG